MNLWAKNATKGLIEKVLPPDTIDHKTVFILANALYFKGAWLNAFDAKLTRHEYFYPHDGEYSSSLYERRHRGETFLCML